MAPPLRGGGRKPGFPALLAYQSYEASFPAQYITAFLGRWHKLLLNLRRGQGRNYLALLCRLLRKPTQRIPTLNLCRRKRQRSVGLLHPNKGVFGALIHRDLHNDSASPAGASRAIDRVGLNEPPLSTGTPIPIEIVVSIAGVLRRMLPPIRIVKPHSVGSFIVLLLDRRKEF